MAMAISPRFIFLSAAFFLAQSVYADSKPAIEIIPVAVWQGRQDSPLSQSLLDALRKSWPDSRIAHAVSAAPLARSEDSKRLFKEQLSLLVRSGDDLLLHMAPWKSLAEKASVPFKFAPTLFGVRISEQDCMYDCGLELSFTAYSGPEIKSMVAASRKLLSENGMGAPAAVYFDEGVTSDELHLAARQEGIIQDWSGVEMTQMKSSLGRFPVYQMNREYAERLPLADPRKEQVDGLVLDHVRYGIHAEIADLESSEKIFRMAVDHAKNVNRVVRIPIVFNVDDLYYTHEFVRDAVLNARTVAQGEKVDVVPWVPQNLTWDLGKPKQVSPPLAVAVATVAMTDHVDSGEPEFIPQDEAELERSLELDMLAH